MSIPYHIQSSINANQNVIKRLTNTIPLAIQIDELCQSPKFKALKPQVSTTYVQAYDSNQLGINIRLTASDPAKTAKKALQLLAAAGFKRNPEDKEPFKNENLKLTEWKLVNFVTLQVVSDGEHCRKVQVGTKTVPEHEEPIYETLCGDALKDWLKEQEKSNDSEQTPSDRMPVVRSETEDSPQPAL